MHFQFIVFLTFLNVVLGNVSQELSNSSNSQVVASNIYDDIELAQIKDNLSSLQNLTKELIHKIDLQELKINQMNLSLHQMLNDLINASFSKLSQQLLLQQLEIKKEEELNLPKDCTIALQKNGQNGIYRIEVPNSNLPPFDVYCLRNGNTNSTNTSTDWMVIERRVDGSVDFHHNWVDYQDGFGNLDGEFFIGLKKLHAITKSSLHELWIQMENFDGEKRWAKYNNFSIGNEAEAYVLKSLGTSTGNAGGALSSHINQIWSTKNDRKNCGKISKGAWSYKDCHFSNLNGYYIKGEYKEEILGKDIEWWSVTRTLHSLKYVQMAIRAIN